jgi:CRISPR-associated protein Csb2
MSVFGGSDRAQSATLSGRSHESDPLQSQHAHAHYLAFSSRSDSRLDTALVWAPNGFSIEELNSLSGLKQLRPHDAISDLRPCRVGLEGFGRVEDIAPEVVGPSRTWRSFTPFAPTRHKQANESLADFLTAEVARELRYRRIQAPAKVEMVKGDWLSFRRHRPSGRDTLSTARRAYGLRLDFAEPISGPIVIGGLSHFGLGLFVPEQ